jgi:hypothetical protein
MQARTTIVGLSREVSLGVNVNKLVANFKERQKISTHPRGRGK